MKRTITTERLPIKMWLDYLEDGAQVQAKNLANLEPAVSHIAIMPDAHQGYGMPIGTVAALDGAISPNMVGVDIGCGMSAKKTDLKEISTEDLKKVLGIVRKKIPVGFNRHPGSQDTRLMPNCDSEKTPIAFENYNAATCQLGTLGGGNHFIEIQKDQCGRVWIMIHSGSRNIGFTVAKHYNDIAKKECKDKFALSADLAYLDAESDIGRQYIAEMQYCVEFACQNRSLMMSRVVEAFENTVGDFIAQSAINIAHNYASYEDGLYIHRKGATKATVDTFGAIPGSQGTKSYIVQGKGNKDSFESCSHGAGRKMSRSQAKKILTVEDEAGALDKMGVIHSVRTESDLDEAPSAYKDITEVMANQDDLVDVTAELKPLAVIKG